MTRRLERCALFLFALFPTLGQAVPCQPLPSPRISMSYANPAACRLAVQNGGACTVNITVSNTGAGNSTTIALGRQLVGNFTGTIAENPPASGPRDSTDTAVGTAQVFSVGANATVNLSQIVTFAAGSRYTCLQTIINSENPLCGSTSDVRRQYVVGSAAACLLSPAYPASSSYYKMRRNCASSLWYNSGGTCKKGPDCWFHDQLFTRILSEEESANWGQKNCRHDEMDIDTEPLGSEADGPYGYDLGT